MDNFFKLIIAWIGNPLRGLATAMIASLILLWLRMRHYQAFDELVKDPFWRWPMLALIVSVSGLTTYPLAWGGEQIRKKLKSIQYKKNSIKRLHKLTIEQKHILQRYIGEGSKTTHGPIDDGVFNSLVHEGIIYPAVSAADARSFPFNISEVAWEYLNAHPDLIATPDNPPPAPGPYDWMSR